MTGEAGYRALERGDLIVAFNEFSAAEKIRQMTLRSPR